MGVFDSYGSTQIKVGPCRLDEYNVGDSVPIPDGVYVGSEGVVVIVGGQFRAEFDCLVDKWGQDIPTREVIESRWPGYEVLRKVRTRGRQMNEDERKLWRLSEHITNLCLMAESLKLDWNWEPTWPKVEQTLNEAEHELRKLYQRLIADREKDPCQES